MGEGEKQIHFWHAVELEAIFVFIAAHISSYTGH